MNDEEMKKLLHPAQYQEGDDQPPANPEYRIAVIPKGTTHEFWKSVHAGASQAAKEAGNVEIFWKGPLQENDTDGQINVVQEFITKKVDGIVLAPLDSQALIAVVKDAKAQGIPTVIFDSALADQSDIVSYVATDNYDGGALAARRLAEVLGHKPAAK
jgi:ribose transport system substrate-binding protein